MEAVGDNLCLDVEEDSDDKTVQTEDLWMEIIEGISMDLTFLLLKIPRIKDLIK